MNHLHHIIPRHVFSKETPKSVIDHPSNLFPLNPTQHALAHRNIAILGIHRNSYKDWAAWKLLSGQWGKEETWQLLSRIACKTPEFRAKMSASKLGKKRPPLSLETRKKMSVAKMGNNVWKGRKHSQESNEKNRLAHLGKKQTEETRTKISTAKKGRKLSQEHRAKIGAAQIGKKRSEETKRKMSFWQIGRKRGKLKPYRPRISKTLNIISPT